MQGSSEVSARVPASYQLQFYPRSNHPSNQPICVRVPHLINCVYYPSNKQAVHISDAVELIALPNCLLTLSRQSANRKKHSTEMALACVLSDFLKAAEEDRKEMLLYLLARYVGRIRVHRPSHHATGRGCCSWATVSSLTSSVGSAHRVYACSQQDILKDQPVSA